MTQTLAQLSTAQLRQALQLREQMDSLQAQLEAILGGDIAPAAAAPAAKPAKIKAGKPASKPAAPMAKTPSKKSGGGIDPERRAKLSAAMKASWAAKKAAAADAAAK